MEINLWMVCKDIANQISNNKVSSNNHKWVHNLYSSNNSYFKCKIKWLNWCNRLKITPINSKWQWWLKCSKWWWWCKIWWGLQWVIQINPTKINNSISNSSNNNRSKWKNQILRTTCFQIYSNLLQVNHKSSNNTLHLWITINSIHLIMLVMECKCKVHLIPMVCNNNLQCNNSITTIIHLEMVLAHQWAIKQTQTILLTHCSDITNHNIY